MGPKYISNIFLKIPIGYSDVIMSAMEFQVTDVSIIYSNVC